MEVEVGVLAPVLAVLLFMVVFGGLGHLYCTTPSPKVQLLTTDLLPHPCNYPGLKKRQRYAAALSNANQATFIPTPARVDGPTNRCRTSEEFELPVYSKHDNLAPPSQLGVTSTTGGSAEPPGYEQMSNENRLGEVSARTQNEARSAR